MGQRTANTFPISPTEMLFVFVGPPGHLPRAGKVEIIRRWSVEVLEMSACQNRAEDDHAGSTVHFAIIRILRKTEQQSRFFF